VKAAFASEKLLYVDERESHTIFVSCVGGVIGFKQWRCGLEILNRLRIVFFFLHVHLPQRAQRQSLLQARLVAATDLRPHFPDEERNPPELAAFWRVGLGFIKLFAFFPRNNPRPVTTFLDSSDLSRAGALANLQHFRCVLRLLVGGRRNSQRSQRVVRIREKSWQSGSNSAARFAGSGLW